MHCIFLGAAGVGKSCLMKRLLGEKVDITNRISTELAEKSVRVVSTTVAEVSDFNWQKVDDTAHELLGQITEEEVESKKENQKQHRQANHLEEGHTNEQFNQREGTQASVKEQKDEPLSAIKDANKQFPEQTLAASKQNVLKQQEGEPDDSQRTNSNDASQATKSTSRGSLMSQQLKFDFLRNVLKKEGVSGMKKCITNQKTIYLTDSGGQPEFQELLPALVVGPCIFIVVLPLNRDLRKKYKVDYVRPGKQECMPTYSSSLTMQEDLMRSLASIASTKCKNKDGKEVEPMVMFVATFIDEIPPEDLQEKLNEIKALIIKETDAHSRVNIVYVPDTSNTRMVFTMNNASDDAAEKDAKKIRAAFEEIAKYFEVPTPWSWLIFSILVQHEYGSVIDYEKCFELARGCGIKSEMELEAALKFLHRQTGILHYYKDLNQIVVRDPQHLFYRVNHLVENTFIPQNIAFGKCTEAFKKGLFKREHYYELTKKFFHSELTPSMLLELLEHLHVVVRLDHDGESYFMPCALTHLEPSAIGISQSDAIPPLLITFKSGYCPKGLFGSLVSCIANKRVSNSTLDLDQSEIYRDQICFKMGEGRLLLRVNPTFIYIEIIPCNPDESLSTLSKLCNGIRKLIFENISEASKTLHYSLKEDTDYFLSFKGRCNQCNKDHPVVLQPVQNDKHLKVHSFQCKQSLEKVEPILKCYIWLPEVSRQLYTVCTINKKCAHPILSTDI